jgi:hypothetical protein
MSLDHANTELNIQDIERQANLRQRTADYAVKAYAEYHIEYEKFLALLQAEDFNDAEIAGLAQEAELQRISRLKRPSELQYAKLLKKGKITEYEFGTAMQGLGYDDQYIPILIMEAYL